MKVGATSQKKTLIAVGLFIVAIIMTIRMIGSNFTSSSSPAQPAASAPKTASRTTSRRGGIRRGPRGLVAKQNGSTAPVTPSLDPRLHLQALKETESIEYAGNGRNIFRSQETDIQIEKPLGNGLKTNAKVNPPAPVTPPPYTPPPPPPINLKFFGFANQQGTGKTIFLSTTDNQGDIFVAKEGDIVQRRYKILKVNPTSIEVQDVLSNNRQTIPLTQG